MNWFNKKDDKSEKSEEKFKIKADAFVDQIPKKQTCVSFLMEIEVLHPLEENMTELIKNLEVGLKLPANCEITDSYVKRIQVLEKKSL